MYHTHKPLFEPNKKGMEGGTKAESEEVIDVKVEDPEIASKSPVFSRLPSRRDTELAPLCLCPKGSWKAICCFFMLGCLVTVILFIIDIFHHLHDHHK
uniref:Uncharacterized protein LOC105852265 isoform X2 n=1 Tax=Cicer arietinum TaxID=3827 RepID=A0A1S3EA74_CICAR|nr:uncharacterized protein LOC105852265 isoform X2 [Cicer arietinum]